MQKTEPKHFQQVFDRPKTHAQGQTGSLAGLKSPSTFPFLYSVVPSLATKSRKPGSKDKKVYYA